MSNPNPTNMLAAGTLLAGCYRIEKYLSSGGCGNTYLAKNTKFSSKKSRVVVKEFFLNGITHREQSTSRVIVSNRENAEIFERLRRKFRDEADRINELRHPNIVRVSDVFDANHTSYYVMDFIPGGSLDHRAGKLTERQAVKYVRQVLQALDVVHQEGLYHLDLKPANVMLDQYDNAILIDFGASKMLGGAENNTLSSTILYTKGYAPSEQMYRDIELIGSWTDIYAVGATLYNLLTGNQPPSPSVLGMQGEAAFDMAGADEGIRAFVVRCMKGNISERPHSVAEALDMLDHAHPSDSCIAKPVIVVDSADGGKPAPLFPVGNGQGGSSAPLVQGEVVGGGEKPVEAKSALSAPDEPYGAPSVDDLPVPPGAGGLNMPPPPAGAGQQSAGPFPAGDGASDTEPYHPGADLSSDTVPYHPDAPQPAAPPSPVTPSGQKRAVRIAVAACVLAGIGIFGFGLWSGLKKNQTDPSDTTADSTSALTETLSDSIGSPADTTTVASPAAATVPQPSPVSPAAQPSSATASSSRTSSSSSRTSSSSDRTSGGSTSVQSSQSSTQSYGRSSSTSGTTSSQQSSSGSRRQTLDFTGNGAGSSAGTSSQSSSQASSRRSTLDFTR